MCYFFTLLGDLNMALGRLFLFDKMVSFGHSHVVVDFGVEGVMGGRGRGRGDGDRGSAMRGHGGVRGGGRGGRGHGGGGTGRMKGGSKVVVESHRHEGVFIAKGKQDALVTKNMVPGEACLLRQENLCAE
ncbi:hypothetical protein BT93_H2017 [Corymbia citriodora subsp. variegata]|nr:hypothetical protein BT93_H2017 [Corymbia citriodora subsp. variegata]